MATVMQTQKPFNHQETQRHVRHPLGLVRNYIRVYIFLEGLALTLLCVSLVFWLGMAFDFGLFSLDVPFLCGRIERVLPEETPAWIFKFIQKIAEIDVHGVDWIQELNEADPYSIASRGCRIIVLTVVVVVLLAIGLLKVGMRWLREFNDRAVAMVLERRFQKQLGDRLITAIELADPKLSQKYGYSQAMLEKTILEAVATLKKLPVASVFNWRRLFGLWFLTGVTTFGFLFVTTMVFWGGSAVFADQTVDPIGFSWRFYDVASICTERNILMQNTYWPRRAHLEIARFQPSREEGKQNEMRVAKDDVRPDLQVRAIEWVIADRDAPSGWRALTWRDLSERRLIEPDLLEGVKVPDDFKEWAIDPDELEPNLVAALFGTETQVRKSGDVRAHFLQASIAHKIKVRGEADNLKEWLDWQKWTVDKIAVQMDDTSVRPSLRGLRKGEDLDNLDAIVKKLDELAASPMMTRTLRRLEVPRDVEVTFRGRELSAREHPSRDVANKFTVSLESLKESSRFQFRARAEDFYTPLKYIALVPAPQPEEIHIDKQEPAYLYHRLHGIDQLPLQGLKHQTKNFPLSTTGELNTISIPSGTDLVIHVKPDRGLHPEKAVFIKEHPILEPGFVGYQGNLPRIDDDYRSFSLVINEVTRNQEFSVEFFDEDNIRGRRRFQIKRDLDKEPDVGPLAIAEVSLRKPKSKATQPGAEKEKETDKDIHDARTQELLRNSYLITPDALLPFECSVKDDYGLVRVGWYYKVRKVDFDLTTGTARRLPPEVEQEMRRVRVPAALSGLQFLPENPLSMHFAPYHIYRTSKFLRDELRIAGFREAYVPSEAFDDLLERERRKGRMDGIEAIKNNLTKSRTPQTWEFDFRQDRGFDVPRYIKALKAVDVDKSVQPQFFLQISVQATDNNVEKGQDYDINVKHEDENVETETPYLNDKGLSVEARQKLLRGNTRRNEKGTINFLVVSENELLAQIALEEEAIAEKLEAAKERLDASITSLVQQLEKTKDKDTNMETLRFRMDEIRTVISTTGGIVRDAEVAYKNIGKEMDVNRVRSDRKNKIADTIYYPIKYIVEKDERVRGSGSHIDAEAAFQAAISLVEEDANAKREPIYNQHRPLMNQAEREMRRFSFDIDRVLNAMQEGITEARLITILNVIDREQGKQSKILLEKYRKAVKDLLDDVLKDKPAPMPKKDASSLRGGAFDVPAARLGMPALAGTHVWDIVPANGLHRLAPGKSHMAAPVGPQAVIVESNWIAWRGPASPKRSDAAGRHATF